MFRAFNKIHFTGIGGIGMSGIAELYHGLGYIVTGSDKAYSEVTDRLVSLGITVYEGHAAENVKDPDVLVYSSAVAADNPELTAAREKNIPVIKRAEMLAECMRMKYGIGISGTHGKTTTTSMVGMMLTEAGWDPTIIVGGKLSSLDGSNARYGKGDFIVVEADEFDRSFLKLFPVIAAITNIEAEHLDTYTDLDDIKRTFIEYASRVPFYGFVTACIDEPGVRAIIPALDRRVITYGTDESADLRAVNIKHSGFKSSFDIYYKGENRGNITLKLPGLHVVKNSLAALVIGLELGISFETIKTALEAFTGVFRRFEIKYDAEVMVIDDYAHHPTEAAVTLEGIRKGWDRRLVAVFQPHLYTRTRDFHREFARAFLNSDVFICTDVYPARELPIPGISGKLIADAASELGHPNVHYLADKKELPALLRQIKKDGDIFITMGAGDIWKYGEEFVKTLRSSYKA